MEKPSVVIIVMILGFILPGITSARTWTQAATGRTIEAEVVKVSGNAVVLKLQNGRTANVPVASLSLEDRRQLADEVREKIVELRELTSARAPGR